MTVSDNHEQSTLTAALPAASGFVRDRLTLIGYFLFGYWSYVWAAFGAFVPFLRSEMHLSCSAAALHFSALATGPILAGLTGNLIIVRAGQRRAILSGAMAVAFGTALVVFGQSLVATISGATLIGFGGCIMGQAITTLMSDRFGAQRAIGITECYIASSVCGFLAPMTISLLAKFGLDWRGTLLYSIGLFAAVFGPNIGAFSSIRTQVESSAIVSGGPRLSSTYWILFAVIFLSVASEWSVAFWSSEFTAQTLHLSKSDAAISMSVFLLGMFVGRFAGTRLLSRFSVAQLLPVSAWAALAGFLLFWLSRSLPLNLLGLLIMGLGESNIYPLCLSEAIGSVLNQATKATTRMSLSTGSAILIAPLFLGLLSDRFGINLSYALVAVFLFLAAAAIQTTQKHRGSLS
jgi:fucose permease